MYQGLVSYHPDALQQVRIGVPSQERDLKKRHAGVPDRRAAAQQGQNQFCHHRLDQKHKGGAGKDGHGEEGRWGLTGVTVGDKRGHGSRIALIEMDEQCSVVPSNR